MSDFTDDDDRHGTYAGVQAHRKHCTPLCDPCKDARFLYTKKLNRRLAQGTRHRVPLGEEAHRVLCNVGATEVALASGLNRNFLYRLLGTGPTRTVLLDTRDRILNTKPRWTPVGVQRRMQALMAIGYSGARLGAMIGSGREAIRDLAQRDVQFVQTEFAERVVTLYAELAYVPPAPSRAVTRTRNRAQRSGWAPPAAWDDIDLDDEPATFHRMQRRSVDTLAEYDRLIRFGESHEQALVALGVGEDAIERARAKSRHHAGEEVA